LCRIVETSGVGSKVLCPVVVVGGWEFSSSVAGPPTGEPMSVGVCVGVCDDALGVNASFSSSVKGKRSSGFNSDLGDTIAIGDLAGSGDIDFDAEITSNSSEKRRKILQLKIKMHGIKYLITYT
jgi:hypothetical protein